MRLWLIALPLFLGRTISYSLWGGGSAAAAQRVSFECAQAWPYLDAYFVLSQILLLMIVYAFARIDWWALFNERKLRLMSKAPGPVPPRDAA